MGVTAATALLRAELQRTARAWMSDGACLGMDVHLFFPRSHEGSDLPKAVCAGCKVRTTCLDHALKTGEKWGVWGGTTEKERRQLRHRRRAA